MYVLGTFQELPSLTSGLAVMPNIVIELDDGSLGPIELLSSAEKTAAMVLDACSHNFNRGLGSLSPKDQPKFILEDGDVLAGGMAYVFTPSAGSQGMHQIIVTCLS